MVITHVDCDDSMSTEEVREHLKLDELQTKITKIIEVNATDMQGGKRVLR